MVQEKAQKCLKLISFPKNVGTVVQLSFLVVKVPPLFNQLSIPMENITATWKKARKCNKIVNCSKSNEVSDLGFIHNKAFMIIGWAPF